VGRTYIPQPACTCTDHGFVALVAKLGRSLLTVRCPATATWPSPDDEHLLDELFGVFIASDLRLLQLVNVLWEDEP
jgi:hypothetical protein